MSSVRKFTKLSFNVNTDQELRSTKSYNKLMYDRRGGDVKKAWVNIRDTIGDDAEYDVLVDGMQDNSVLPYN